MGIAGRPLWLGQSEQKAGHRVDRLVEELGSPFDLGGHWRVTGSNLIKIRFEKNQSGYCGKN